MNSIRPACIKGSPETSFPTMPVLHHNANNNVICQRRVSGYGGRGAQRSKIALTVAHIIVIRHVDNPAFTRARHLQHPFDTAYHTTRRKRGRFVEIRGPLHLFHIQRNLLVQCAVTVKVPVKLLTVDVGAAIVHVHFVRIEQPRPFGVIHQLFCIGITVGVHVGAAVLHLHGIQFAHVHGRHLGGDARVGMGPH